MRRTERALSVICALLPLAGVLLFDWSLATVLFVIWVDTWLHSLRGIPTFMNENAFEPYATHPAGRLFLNLLLGTMVWCILTAPIVSAIGIAFHELAWRIRPGGFRAELNDLLAAPWWLAIIVGGRLFPGVRNLIAARAEGRQRFFEFVKVEFFIGMGKCLVLLPLAWFAPVFAHGGFWGVLAFAALASLTIVAADWYLEYHLNLKPAAAKPAKPLEVVHGFDGRTWKR